VSASVTLALSLRSASSRSQSRFRLGLPCGSPAYRRPLPWPFITERAQSVTVSLSVRSPFQVNRSIAVPSSSFKSLSGHEPVMTGSLFRLSSLRIITVSAAATFSASLAACWPVGTLPTFLRSSLRMTHFPVAINRGAFLAELQPRFDGFAFSVLPLRVPHLLTLPVFSASLAGRWR
jgi:hypothetical protein